MHHSPLPDSFFRAAVFTIGGVFVRWLPDGVPAHTAAARGLLASGEHAADFDCTRKSVWSPVLPDPTPAPFDTTRGEFQVRWFGRRVVVTAPDGIGEQDFWAASLPDALAKVQLACASLASRGHAGPPRPRLPDDTSPGGTGLRPVSALPTSEISA